jgi:hypothetical protein
MYTISMGWMMAQYIAMNKIKKRNEKIRQFSQKINNEEKGVNIIIL